MTQLIIQLDAHKGPEKYSLAQWSKKTRMDPTNDGDAHNWEEVSLIDLREPVESDGIFTKLQKLVEDDKDLLEEVQKQAEVACATPNSQGTRPFYQLIYAKFAGKLQWPASLKFKEADRVVYRMMECGTQWRNY